MPQAQGSSSRTVSIQIDHLGWRGFSTQIVIAVVAPQFLGALAGWQVAGWTSWERVSEALSAALAPLGILLALALFLLAPNRRVDDGEESKDAQTTRTNAALGFAGFWSWLATLSILVHIAHVPNWERRYTASLSVALTVTAFATLAIVPTLRNVLAQPSPPSNTGARLAARAIDVCIAGALVAAVWAVFEESLDTRFAYAQLAYFASAVVIVGAYETLFGWCRRSPGKALLRLRIVDTRSVVDGRPTQERARLWQVALRSLIVAAAMSTTVALVYGSIREADIFETLTEQAASDDSIDDPEPADFLTGWFLVVALAASGVAMSSPVIHRQAQGIHDTLSKTVVVNTANTADHVTVPTP